MPKIDEKNIPLDQLEQLGLSLQMLRTSGDLKKLLNGERTGLITNIKTRAGSVEGKFAGYLRLLGDGGGKYWFRIEPATVEELIIAKIRPATAAEIIIDKIPFQSISKFGITQESLRESDALEKLLQGEKTPPLLITLPGPAGQDKISAARLYLALTPQGKLIFQMDLNVPLQTLNQLREKQQREQQPAIEPASSGKPGGRGRKTARN